MPSDIIFNTISFQFKILVRFFTNFERDFWTSVSSEVNFCYFDVLTYQRPKKIITA